jgi:hypothetical protein
MTSPKEIVFKDTQKTAMYACGGCGICYTLTTDGEDALRRAEACCGPNLCACGKEARKHYISCPECIAAKDAEKERKQYDAAEKLPIQPEDSGMLYWGDDYYSSWDEVIDRCESPEAVPEYVYATMTRTWHGLDVGDILGRASEEYPVEDETLADRVTDAKELEDFVKQWNAKQSVVWFEADFKRVVLRPSDYRKNFEEAA